MGHNKRLIENIGSLTVLQGANYVLPLIILPYLVRVLGPEKFGLVVFAQAFTQYLVVLTDYGFNLTATRQIAIQRDNLQEVSKIFSSVMLIKFALMFVSFALMATIVLSVPKFRSDWQVYFISFPMVLGSVLFPVWLFQGMERMKYITILNLTAKCIAILAVFAFVHSRADYLLAVAVQSGGFVLAGLMGVWVAWRHIGVRLIRLDSLANVGTALREGAQVFVAQISGNVYGQGAVVITGLLAGHTAAGYYSLAQKIAGAVSGLIQPVAQGIYPRLTQLFTEGSSGYDKLRKRVFMAGGSVGLVAGLTVFLFSDTLSAMVCGHSSRQLAVLIKILGLAATMDVLNVLLNSFIVAMKEYTQMRKMYTMVAILFVFTSIPATYLFGAPGMAIVMLGVVEVFVLTRSIQISKLFGGKGLCRD